MGLEDLAIIETLYPVISKCPFCGSKASPNSHLGSCWVECHSCGTKGPRIIIQQYSDGISAYERSINAWERRVE